MLISIGCSAKKSSGVAPPHPVKKNPSPAELVNIRGGSVVYTGTKSERLFLVRFQSGLVSLTTDDPAGDSQGTMNGVTGEIYQHIQTSSTFQAKQGQGDQVNQRLTLNGSVQVTSKDPAITLTCDRMVYDGKTKIIKAIGNVRVMGTMSTEDTIKELWATPDLKKIATPDMFYQQ